MKRRGGFTLIELSLSLVFIAILSLTVVLLIQNTMASYRRGMILNQVNTVGMDLIDDMRSSVQYATSDPATRMCEMYYGKDENPTSNYNKCINDGAFSFISVTREARVNVTSAYDGRNLLDKTLPVYGAFCTGTYTYVWASGYFETADGEIRNVEGASRPVLKVESSTGGIAQVGVHTIDFLEEAAGAAVDTASFEKFRLLKVYDDERSICVNAMKNQALSGGGVNYVTSNSYEYNKVGNEFVLSEEANDEDEIDLLDQGDANDLAIYDFYVSRPAESVTRKNIFYAASFILGTRRGGIDITQVGNSCKAPSDYNSNLDYCAINKFNFAVQAGGER